MKLISIISLLFFMTNIYAARVSVGVIIGEPTGLSCKIWPKNKEIAFDLAFAFKFNDLLYFHFDFLKHNFKLIPKEELTGDLPLFWGLGLKIKNRKIKDESKSYFGLRAPVGFEYIFKEIPFDIFAEIVPVVLLTPNITAELNAVIGIRYHFLEFYCDNREVD